MKKLAMSAWCALVFLIVPFALTAQLPSYLPTNGLVAWYPFNGNANDESGNNQNTLGENATLASDRFNNPNSAYYFDGSAFFQNTSINLTSNPGITISTWFKVTDFNEAQGGHLCMFYSEPRAFQVFITNQGITFRVWNYDLVFDLSSNLFTENEWHNVIITSNFINETKIYLDGELRSQLPNGVPVPQNNSYFTIGKHSFFQPPAGAYKGYLDDIAIYARALNSAEIQQLLNSSSGPSEEGGFGGPVLPLTPSPPGIPYQAEVRNESGEVLANANVNVRFTLHEQAANGTVSYQETHSLTTNEIGLFAATIGAGTATQGTFAGINWAQTTKFLQVEVDTGNGWITMGNQQLMSVPYALYAANGPVGPAGADGQPGIDGINGRDGVSIYNAYIENGQLFLMLTDNTIISAGSVNNGGGCTNPSACNYNPYYNYDNGSCYYPGYPCDDNNPETHGEVYDRYCQCALAIPGCTNSLACNYNPTANQDDGSCITLYGPCSDGNITTVNDYINDECQCVGFTSISNGTIGNGVTDASGNNYPTVIIGGQEWMAENLRTTKYANGDLIGYNLSPVDWANTAWGAWTSPRENVAGSNEIYGKLYNTAAILDSRQLCPTGYHIPSTTDWNTLIGNLPSLSNLLWVAPNLGTPGIPGFSGLTPQWVYGYYQDSGCAYGCNYTYYPAISLAGFTYTYFSGGQFYFNQNAGGPSYGIPVRCIKN